MALIFPLVLINQAAGVSASPPPTSITIGTPTLSNDQAIVSGWSFSHTVSGEYRVLIVGVGAVDTTVGDTVATAVSYNGVAMSLMDSQTSAAGNQDIGSSLWILVAPDTGTHDVAITLTGECVGACAIACTFTGVHQTSPQAATAVGTFDAGVTSIADTIGNSNYTNALGVDLCCTRLIKTHNVGTAPQALLDTASTTGGQDCTLSMSTELDETPGLLIMSRNWTTGDICTLSIGVLRPAGAV